MTPAQQRVYDAVGKLGEDGWSVTVREVADEIGLSVQTVHAHLTALTRGGFLQKHPRSSSGGWRVAS